MNKLTSANRIGIVFDPSSPRPYLRLFTGRSRKPVRRAKLSEFASASAYFTRPDARPVIAALVVTRSERLWNDRIDGTRWAAWRERRQRAAEADE